MSEDGDGVPFFAFFAQHNYAADPAATASSHVSRQSQPPDYRRRAGWVTGRPAASG